MKIQKLKLADIKPYWRNPRKNEKAIAAVKQSIESFGFNQPLILDQKNVIIAGHTRYKALIELGWKEAPCVVVDLPSNKAKEYRIADNKTSELAEWDMDALIPELREVVKLDDMQIYFPTLNLDHLLGNTATVADVTREDITKTEALLTAQFEERSDNAQAGYVALTCPHCAGDFFVDRHEFLRQPTQAEPTKL